MTAAERWVSIPSNRVLPSVGHGCYSCGADFESQSPQIGSYLRLEKAMLERRFEAPCLNPLKSGPTFGFGRCKWLISVNFQSLNPLKSGPTFGFWTQTGDKKLPAYVSIPSNRVLPSVNYNADTTQGEQYKSQSPQIGSYLRFKVINMQGLIDLCLNPLKSGPTFGSNR